MALTAAERSKRYRERIKQDPEKHEHHKKKELKRLKKHMKNINELTEEQKEARRKRWREQKRNQKEKKIKQVTGTPQKSTEAASTSTQIAKSKPISHSFKIKHRKLSNNYKTALNKIETYKTALNNLRKKLYRAKKQHEKKILILQTENDKLKARQEVMELTIREAYKDCKKNSEKRIIKNVTLKIGDRMCTKPDRKFLGLKSQVRKPCFRKNLLNKDIVVDLEKFYNRDDISRSTAGKQETRTKNKKKAQIRYLVDTLQNLYQIYKDEGGKYSFTTFFRYKPYYVLSPSAMARNTCMCIKHSNMEFMFDALKLKGVIPYKTTTELLSNIACDTKSFNCMYNKCQLCKIPSIQYIKDKLQGEVTWFKWGRVVHKYEKSGQEMLTKKTTKQQMKSTVQDLISEFEKELTVFKTHYFNWKEQQRQYRDCVINMKDEEIGILCDFSENYDCKYSEEIQSMHFGASKNSITLHCGVIIGKERLQSFVTVSDGNCHEPNAIWAHLMPVVKLAKEEFPNTKIIHFFSDGPSTQYRQKKNFYLLSLFTQKLQLQYSTWSFSEAGHGKSMADGIGGSVKRQLDKRVLYGQDITNGTEACQILQSTMKSVKCFYVACDDIKNFKNLIPDGLHAVPGTMQVHQVISNQANQIQYRQLSCFCGEMRGLCSCYLPKTHFLADHLEPFTEESGTLLPASSIMINPTEASVALIAYPDQDPLIDRSPKTVRVSPTNWPFPIAVEEIESIDLTNSFDVKILETDPFSIIEDLPSVFGECSSLNIPKDVPIVVSPKITTNNAEVSPAVKSAIISNTFDYDTPPIKRVKILKPCAVSLENKVNIRSVNILLPKAEKENHRTKDKINYASSVRTFPCHICKTRQPFFLQEMAKCMVCKKWVCISCSGTTSFDYICDVCLRD